MGRVQRHLPELLGGSRMTGVVGEIDVAKGGTCQSRLGDHPIPEAQIRCHAVTDGDRLRP